MQPPNLEETYGPLLETMSPPELDELLTRDFERRMLRKFGIYSPLLRPKLLEALHQQNTVNHNQQTLEL